MGRFLGDHPPRIRHLNHLRHLKSEAYPVESIIYEVFCRARTIREDDRIETVAGADDEETGAAEIERLKETAKPGIDRTAKVDPTAEVDETAAVLAGVTICAGCKILANAIVEPGTQIEDGTTIGHGVIIGSGVVIGFSWPGCGDVAIGDGIVIERNAHVHSRVRLKSGAEGPQTRIREHAVVNEPVEIGAGSDIGSYTTVGEESWLGERVRVGRGCDIGPHAYFEDDATVGAGSRFEGGNQLGKRAEIGTGVTLDANADVKDDGRVPAGTRLFWTTNRTPDP